MGSRKRIVSTPTSGVDRNLESHAPVQASQLKGFADVPRRDSIDLFQIRNGQRDFEHTRAAAHAELPAIDRAGDQTTRVGLEHR
jgi:hypothetical protein